MRNRITRSRGSLRGMLEGLIQEPDVVDLCYEIATLHGIHSIRDIRRLSGREFNTADCSMLIDFALHVWRNERLLEKIPSEEAELSNLTGRVATASEDLERDKEILAGYRSDREFIEKYFGDENASQ